MKAKSKLMAALTSLKDHSSSSGPRSILSTVDLAILRSTDSSAYSSSSPDIDKYVHEILFEISNNPGAITFLARRLSARLASARDMAVALKTLLLLHRLLRSGDRYFEQDLRSLWSSGDLKLDLAWTAADRPIDPVRVFTLRYSQFLKERMDWIIDQAGKLEPNVPSAYRERKLDSVLYRVSKCQTFLDRIVDCLPTAIDTDTNTDTILRLAMSIILRESFRVYVSFCDDMEIVSGSMSELRKPARVLATDIFRKSCAQSCVLREYYNRCKMFMAGKNLDYPSVRVFTDADVSSVESQFADSSPFSGGMETRISTVWVDFDEDEEQTLRSGSSFSFEGFEDCGSYGAGAGTINGGESSVKGKVMELL